MCNSFLNDTKSHFLRIANDSIWHPMCNRRRCFSWPWTSVKGQILQFASSSAFISNTTTNKPVVQVTTDNDRKVINSFFEWFIYNWSWPILKVLKATVTIIHISTMNILELVTDRIKIPLPWNRKLCMGFQLAYLHLTMAKSKGLNQGHAYFDNQYLTDGDIIGKITIVIK